MAFVFSLITNNVLFNSLVSDHGRGYGLTYARCENWWVPKLTTKWHLLEILSGEVRRGGGEEKGRGPRRWKGTKKMEKCYEKSYGIWLIRLKYLRWSCPSRMLETLSCISLRCLKNLSFLVFFGVLAMLFWVARLLLRTDWGCIYKRIIIFEYIRCW